MATAAAASTTRREVKEYTFSWEGRDRSGKIVKGDMRASGEAVVQSSLRRQGIAVIRVKRQRSGLGGRIKEKDITLFTRQLATMMKAGVPLLQSFDIVGKGHANPAVGRLLLDIKTEVETGSALHTAFRKYPLYFDALFCNLVAAGEAAGILDALLDRLATYKEKILAIKSKIKSALFYPIAVVVVAIVVVWVIMIFVIPAFKNVFKQFGADLPWPTQFAIDISDFVVAWWWLIAAVLFGTFTFLMATFKRSAAVRFTVDRLILKFPVIGPIIEKATIARWTRTLQTMFAAGVPLVESLDAVGGAAGNSVYAQATRRIQTEVSTGTSLTNAMANTKLFPTMVLQMTQIGEESGSLDNMLGKIADFFEREVDDAVAALSSLLEPIIIVFLGVVIGGLVVAMYLPIFKLGAVI